MFLDEDYRAVTGRKAHLRARWAVNPDAGEEVSAALNRLQDLGRRRHRLGWVVFPAKLAGSVAVGSAVLLASPFMLWALIWCLSALFGAADARLAVPWRLDLLWIGILVLAAAIVLMAGVDLLERPLRTQRDAVLKEFLRRSPLQLLRPVRRLDEFQIPGRMSDHGVWEIAGLLAEYDRAAQKIEYLTQALEREPSYHLGSREQETRQSTKAEREQAITRRDELITTIADAIQASNSTPGALRAAGPIEHGTA